MLKPAREPQGAAVLLQPGRAVALCSTELAAVEHAAAQNAPLHTQPAPLQARRLQPQWPGIVSAMAAGGEVACTVGHADCALTRTVPCRPDSGLDLDFDAWCHGFAVRQNQSGGSPTHSLQFIAADGRPIVKFVLTARKAAAVFSDRIETFGTRAATAGAVLQDGGAALARLRGGSAEHLRQAWASLRHADAVAALFRRLGVSELQAVQGLGADYASPLAVESAQELLSRAAQAGLAVRVCGSVNGAALRWSGQFSRIAVAGACVTATAPDALLWWQEDRVASAWLVKTPTSVGLGHALALFDHQGGPMLRIESARQPGRPEPCQWRELLCSLIEERVPCRC